jgi:hypothetical protein
MSNIGVNVLVEAKNQYTKRLINTLVNHIYDGIQSIYDDSIKLEDENVFGKFQEMLKQVPKWNQEMIDQETQRIVNTSDCEWLADLITAVFLSNTRILTAVRLNSAKDSIDLKIPKLSHFVHKCYIECAREFYKNPFIFDNTISKGIQQKNMRESLSLIAQSIQAAIDRMLPYEQILMQYIGESFESDDEDVGDSRIKRLKKRIFGDDFDSEYESDYESDESDDDIDKTQVGGQEDTLDENSEELGVDDASTKDVGAEDVEEYTSAENASAENASAENASAENASAENASAENASAKNASAENASAENASAENASAENASAENASAENTSAENAGAENAGAENAGAENAGAKEEEEAEEIMGYDSDDFNNNESLFNVANNSDPEDGEDISEVLMNTSEELDSVQDNIQNPNITLSVNKKEEKVIDTRKKFEAEKEDLSNIKQIRLGDNGFSDDETEVEKIKPKKVRKKGVFVKAVKKKRNRKPKFFS